MEFLWFLWCEFWLFHRNQSIASSIQRQQLSFNGWGRLSLTAKLQTWWFLSPNPTQTLNEMPLAISWRSKCIYSSFCCVKCSIWARRFIMIVVKTGFLVGILMPLYHLQGLFNVQWTWEDWKESDHPYFSILSQNPSRIRKITVKLSCYHTHDLRSSCRWRFKLSSLGLCHRVAWYMIESWMRRLSVTLKYLYAPTRIHGLYHLNQLAQYCRIALPTTSYGTCHKPVSYLSHNCYVTDKT